MKKLASIFCFVALASFGLKAQEAAKAAAPAENPNAPVFSFESETHDFGTIKQGANGTYEFKFKNNGKEPLVISNARGSCGCTVPSWPKDPILPGNSSTIKVTYDTQRVGPFTKTVTISSNAKGGEKVITIKGKVEGAPPEEAFPANGLPANGAVPRANN